MPIKIKAVGENVIIKRRKEQKKNFIVVSQEPIVEGEVISYSGELDIAGKSIIYFATAATPVGLGFNDLEIVLSENVCGILEEDNDEQ